MKTDQTAEFYARHGITSAIIETVLPVSGGKGFQIAWYQNGVRMERGITGWAMDRTLNDH